MTIEVVPRILIVSTKVDVATDYVVLKLADLGASFYRVNTEDFPLSASSSVRFEKESDAPSSRWYLGSRRINLDAVRTVWLRRHRLPVLPPEVEAQDVEYCLRESDWFVKGLLYSKASDPDRIAWMSPPANIQRAESKIYQLTAARSLGLHVPDTLVSNDPEEIRSFCSARGGEVVAKPLRLGYFDYGDRQTSVFTSRVSPGDLGEDAPLRMAPVIYQELLPKLFDIRVTVVGQRVFAAAIDSQSVPSAALDWRRSDSEDLPHYTHELPAPVKDACLKYVAALGLNYGALDFVLTPRNEYVFLEINPNGQWVWLEDKLKLPISDAVANWLFTNSES